MTLFKKRTSYYIYDEKLQAINLQHLRDIIMSMWSKLGEELQAPQEFYAMRKWCVRTPFSHAEACLTLPSFSAGLHSRCSRLEDISNNARSYMLHHTGLGPSVFRYKLPVLNTE